MNCLILILLLLCGGNNGSCPDQGCGCNNRRSNDRCGCSHGGQGRSGGDCGCDNDRQEDEGCGCRNDFRSEPRFEQRPFSFNANQVCGCEEPSNNNCDR